MKAFFVGILIALGVAIGVLYVITPKGNNVVPPTPLLTTATVVSQPLRGDQVINIVNTSNYNIDETKTKSFFEAQGITRSFRLTINILPNGRIKNPKIANDEGVQGLTLYPQKENGYELTVYICTYDFPKGKYINNSKWYNNKVYVGPTEEILNRVIAWHELEHVKRFLTTGQDSNEESVQSGAEQSYIKYGPILY